MYTKEDLKEAFKAGERRGSYREKINSLIRQVPINQDDIKDREPSFKEWFGKINSEKD